MKASKPICYCTGTTAEQLEQIINKQGMTVEKAVSETGVGQVCTSCLLDLDLFFDSIGKVMVDGNDAGNLSDAKNNSPEFKQKIIRRDSGVFYCADGYETAISLANYGHSFKEFMPARFKYKCHFVAKTGKIIDCDSGIIEQSEHKTIIVRDFVGSVNGWFLIELIPLGDRFFGTLRPQILYNTGECVFSVHTQPHNMASSGRYRSKVVTMLPRDGETVIVNMINVLKKTNVVNLDLEGVLSGNVHKNHIKLAPLSSADLELDFGKHFLKDEPIYIKATAESPIRNHLLTKSSCGMVSFDHFPN